MFGQSSSPSTSGSGPNSGTNQGSTTNTQSSVSSENAELDVGIDIRKDPLLRGNDQTINVIVSDEDTQQRIVGADTELQVFYTTEFDKSFIDQTNSEGIATFVFEIGPYSNPGTFNVVVEVDVVGYDTESERANFEVIVDDNEDGQVNESSTQTNNTTTDTANNTATSDSESQNVNNVEGNGLPEQQETQQPLGDDISTADDVSHAKTSSDEGNGGDEGSNNDSSSDEGSSGNGDGEGSNDNGNEDNEGNVNSDGNSNDEGSNDNGEKDENNNGGDEGGNNGKDEEN